MYLPPRDIFGPPVSRAAPASDESNMRSLGSPRETGSRRAGLVVGLAVAAIVTCVGVPAAPADDHGVGPSPEDTLLVRFRPGSAAEARADVAEAGAEVEGAIPHTGFSVVSTGGRPADEVRRELEASGAIEEVEPNRVRLAAAVPDDSAYSWQSPYFQAVGLPEAWDMMRSTDSLVLAVLDSGVDLDHPDLVDRLVPGWDFVNNDPVPDDDFGHGTMVAGVAGATTNNGRGVAGAAWGGRIMPIKVLDARGRASDQNIASGITWAVNHGADVVNLSLGGPGSSATLQAAVDYATARNVIVVAAAGNDANSIRHYPAACDGVIAVGATETDGKLATFSNYGSWIDINAPGVAIATTMRGGGEAYGLNSGTSFAAPLVAGVAVLLRAAAPSASVAALADRLRATTSDLGPVGFDSFYGSGFLDAEAALRLTVGPGSSGAGTGAVGGQPGVRSGYWTLGTEGRVYSFGSASHLGDGIGFVPPSTTAVDIEPVAGGGGYWIAAANGAVYTFGNALYLGGLAPGRLHGGESVTSMSATPTGLGYWLFTTSGRVFGFGDAPFVGDMAGTPLNGPVLDSIPTPTGRGYYMVGSDGGIFTFGDADYAGSMGAQRLNAPVQSLVPNPGGSGYWLVAADGGIFSFGDAPYRGSMGGVRLNAPVTGMVAFGNGYLMVATDGGVFNFSDRPFSGSLGGAPPPAPIVAVAPLPV